MKNHVNRTTGPAFFENLIYDTRKKRIKMSESGRVGSDTSNEGTSQQSGCSKRVSEQKERVAGGSTGDGNALHYV